MLCASLLASATETNCGGKCGYSPVIILPGINHSPTYLYDDNDEPVMYNGNHIGGPLLFLNEAALSTKAVLKLVGSALATATFQTNVRLDKVTYNLVSEIFKYQRCDENGDHVENLITQRWNYSLEKMTEEELDRTNLSEKDKAELDAAIAEGEAVLKLTVADRPRVEAAEKRLIAILCKVGAEGYDNHEPEKESPIDPILEDVTYAMSKGSLFLFGGGSLIDRLLSPIRKLIRLITK